MPKFLIALALIALSGCASFSRPALPGSVPPKDTGFVFGRFVLTDQFLANGIGLKMVNQSTKKSVLIPFVRDAKAAVATFSLEPGDYRIQSVVFTFSTGEIRSEQPFRSNLAQQSEVFHVDGGELVYLGDFAGNTQSYGNTVSWAVSSLTNNFEVTTKDFRVRYPRFSDLPTRTFVGLAPVQAASDLSVALAYVQYVLDPVGDDKKKTVRLENKDYRIDFKPGLEYSLLDKQSGVETRGRDTFSIDLKGSGGSRVYLAELDPATTSKDAFLKDEAYVRLAGTVLTPLSVSATMVSYRVVQPEISKGKIWEFSITVVP